MRLFTLVYVLLVAICFTHWSPPRARMLSVTPNSPFDSYGNICWEDEQARLDNFAIALQNNPNVTGQIFVYAGRISCRDEAKYRGNRARNYVMKRAGLDSRRVVFIDRGFWRDVSTLLIIKPKGALEYDLPVSLSKDEVSIRRRCFDKVFELKLCLNRQ